MLQYFFFSDITRKCVTRNNVFQILKNQNLAFIFPYVYCEIEREKNEFYFVFLKILSYWCFKKILNKNMEFFPDKN